MSMSTFLENKVLDHVTGRASFAMPTIHIGLSTADPGKSGSALAEPVGNSYARVAHNGTGKWDASALGVAATNAECVFATASGNWGSVTHMCIFDSLSGGNLLWSGPFTIPKTIQNGDTAKIAVGALTLTLD